jgi:peptide/nickel transport system substrate-binding protein
MIGVGINNTSLYSNSKVDAYMDQALAATNMEEAIEYWKLAQWDGQTGINADYPFLWIVNIDHTYFVRDGLNLGNQMIHPHGHGQPVIANMNEWRME